MRSSVEATEPGFLQQVERTFESDGFCAAGLGVVPGPAHCEESQGGRPGIDPVIYFRMLMVGFFENLRISSKVGMLRDESRPTHAASSP